VKVLITKLSSFGDVIAAFPAVTDAIEAGVQVDWLVDGAFAHVARLHPGVSQVHTLDGRGSRWKPRQWPAYWRQRTALRRTLRAQAYDRVIDLQGLLKSALPARWAGAPVHGYDNPREPAASRLYDVRHPVSWTLHAVERNRALMAAGLGLAPPQILGRFGLTGVSRPPPAGLPPVYAILLHSASWPSKLWPEDRWRMLLERRASAALPVVLPWGSEEERARSQRLAAGLEHVQVLPERLSQEPLAGFLAAAKVAVGLDSGLMHLTHALETPTVWLFGSTSPERTGPYGPGARIVRSTNPNAPCLRRECRHDGGTCMEAVSIEAVFEALDQALAIA
jgi:heptosyltransferase-1